MKSGLLHPNEKALLAPKITKNHVQEVYISDIPPAVEENFWEYAARAAGSRGILP